MSAEPMSDDNFSDTEGGDTDMDEDNPDVAGPSNRGGRGAKRGGNRGGRGGTRGRRGGRGGPVLRILPREERDATRAKHYRDSLSPGAKAQWDEAERLRDQGRRKNYDFVPTRELATEKAKEDRKTHERNKKRRQRAEAKERKQRLANQPAANEPEVVVPEVVEPEGVEPAADEPAAPEAAADETAAPEAAAHSDQMLPPPPVPPLELQRPPATPSPQLAATPSPATRGRPLSRKMSTESVPPRPTSTPRAASATRADKLKLFHAKSQLAAETENFAAGEEVEASQPEVEERPADQPLQKLAWCVCPSCPRPHSKQAG